MLQKNELLKLVENYIVESTGDRLFVPGQTQIPVTEKVVGMEEKMAMVEASLDGWLTTGPFNTLFEDQLAKFTGAKHAITTNSGSSANLLAFSALTSPRLGERAVQKGDEVITVAAGFPTTVNPILQAGAVPVFVDISLPSHNIDVSLLSSALTEKTKAVQIAHTLGNPFNIDEIVTFCKDNELWLVEDCCDALGALYNGIHVGNFGDIGTLSFYPAHHITTGEGGALFTSNDELKRILESFRDWGRDCFCPPGKDNTCGRRFSYQFGGLPKGYDHKYTYSHRGFNLKMTDLQAACGVAQMAKLASFIASRKHNHQFLREDLEVLGDHVSFNENDNHSDPSWFGFLLTLKKNNPRLRADFQKYLETRRIGSRLLFGGNLTKQPYMQNEIFRISGTLDVTDYAMDNTLWIGVHPNLNDEKLRYMGRCVKEFFGYF